AMTSPVNNAAMFGAGSIEALPAITDPIAVDSQTITFASVPDLVPGDTIVIYNTVDGSYNAARTYYRDGECATVQIVDGTTITTSTQRFSSYAADGSVV